MAPCGQKSPSITRELAGRSCLFGIDQYSVLAATASAAGDRRYIFGRGTDQRIWFAHSVDYGVSWQGWSPIGGGLFETGPAAAVNAFGLDVHVAAIGLDGKMHRTRSVDGGATWADWGSTDRGGCFQFSSCCCRLA
jgi:hypothetical protein